MSTKAEELQALHAQAAALNDPVAYARKVREIELFQRENRALIAEALAFFERKEAIRAAIAGLKHCSNEPGIESYSTACVDAALAAFDREAN